jgi:hypothetical protein
MSPTNSVPGLVLPTVQAPLAGSPGASAMAARNNQAQQQTALANAVGGRRRRVKMGANKMGANKMGANKMGANTMGANTMGANKMGANKMGGAITVPQMPGDTSGANAVIAQNARHSTQGAANAQYDTAAMKKGGTRRKKGGNPNWLWGCSSGGRSKRRTSKRRTSKTRRRNKK